MSNLKISIFIIFNVLFINILNAQMPNYQLLKKTLIGGEGGWDYLMVDTTFNQLYVSHGNQVEVLNPETHKKIGVIKDTKGVHGIAIAAKYKKGFTTNGQTNTVSVFNIKDFKVEKEIPTGKKPDAIMFDSFSNLIFVFNNDDASVTVINPETNDVVRTIKLSGNPEAAVSDNKGTIYVNIEDKSEIVAFDAMNFEIKNTFKLGEGEEPTGLAIDLENQLLFSVCHNQLMIIVKIETGEIVASLPIGSRVDGVVFDPIAKRAISSNGEGTLSVIEVRSPTEFVALENIKTEIGARTICLDPKTLHFYTITAEYGEAPKPTEKNPRPRRPVVPNTFTVMEFGVK